MHLTRCKIDLYDCLYLYTIKTAVDWCRNGQSSKLAISDRRSGSDPQILGDLFCHYCKFLKIQNAGAYSDSSFDGSLLNMAYRRMVLHVCTVVSYLVLCALVSVDDRRGA